MSEKSNSTSIWDYVKLGLAIVPAFSLLLACEFFYVFFRNFKGLELNILTLSDYVNKSMELAPMAGFMLAGMIFALWVYPPKFENETQQKYDERIGNTNFNKITESVFLGHFMKWFLPIMIVFALLFRPPYVAMYWVPFLLLIYAPTIMVSLIKYFPEKHLSKIYTRGNIYAVLIAVFCIVNVFTDAHAKAITIRNNFNPKDNFLVDIIDNGYLEVNASYLVLSNRNKEIITKIAITKPDKRSLACRVGIPYTCPKLEIKASGK